MSKKPATWWEAEEGVGSEVHRVHGCLFPYVKAVEEDQQGLVYQNQLNAILYSNRELMAFNWQDEGGASFQPINANLENGIQNVVDTLVSRIGKNRPKATPVSRGADFDVYLKARQLDRWLWGEFLHQKVHEHGERVFKDAVIYGTGFIKVDLDGKEIRVERVHPSEMVIDQRECVSSDTPMQMHRRKLVSRLWLDQNYGKLSDEVKEAIRTCQDRGFQYTSYRSPAEGQIVLVESWKLGPGGRHVICIENCTLVDEPYAEDEFPILAFRWQLPETGFYGRSIVEDLTGYQIRLNELNEDIRIGQNIACVPRLLIEQGSAVTGTKFDNKIGGQITWRGVKPEMAVWPAFPPEIYNERDRVRSAMFEFARVSQLQSQMKLPSQVRLDSSDALREFSSMEQEGFNYQVQGYETFYIRIAEQFIRLGKRLHAGGTSRKNWYRSRYLAEQIDWADIDLDRDRYVLQVSASSIFNMSPAARKDKLNEWVAGSAITIEQYKAMSGEPDLEHMADMMAATRDYTEYSIDLMLKGEPQTPDPFMDLTTGFRTVLDTYLHLRTLEVPPDILILFTTWIENASALMNQTAVVDPNAMGPSASAMAQPGPLPTSPQSGAPASGVALPVAQSFVG